MANAKGKEESERCHNQFVLAYAVTGNASAAAVAAGYGAKLARNAGSLLLGRSDIGPRAHEARQVHLANQAAAYERQSVSLRNAADQAILALLEVLQGARSEMARVQASIAVLDRAGHKPLERVDQNTTHTFDAATTNEIDERLAKIIGASAAPTDSGGDSETSH